MARRTGRHARRDGHRRPSRLSARRLDRGGRPLRPAPHVHRGPRRKPLPGPGLFRPRAARRGSGSHLGRARGRGGCGRQGASRLLETSGTPPGRRPPLLQLPRPRAAGGGFSQSAASGGLPSPYRGTAGDTRRVSGGDHRPDRILCPARSGFGAQRVGVVAGHAWREPIDGRGQAGGRGPRPGTRARHRGRGATPLVAVHGMGRTRPRGRSRARPHEPGRS